MGSVGPQSSFPNHIGIVVKDVEATASLFTAMWGSLGLGSWNFQETSQAKDGETGGGPFVLKLGVAEWPTLGQVFELIQPITANSLWHRFIEEKGEGIHHIAYNASDYDGEVVKLARLGAIMTFSGTYQGRR